MTMDGFMPSTVLDGGAVQHGDDRNLIVEFYWKDKLNPQATEKAGRPIYRQAPYIHIMIPGDKTTDVHRPVREADKARFPQPWALFEAEQEQVTDGTPLSEWTILNVAQRSELKALGFRTVENVASMSDVQMDRIGMGARKLKRMAEGYIENASQGVDSAKMASELEKRDNEIEALKAQLESALERLNEVSKAQPKEDAPKATSEAPAPAEADSDDDDGAGSSLDDLPEPKPVAKKRGRPKKAA